jgi:tellurite resistance protein
LTALDGHRDKREREKVLEYIRSRTADLTYEPDELNEYLISLAPDEVCFSSALSQVLNKGQKVVQTFLETVLDVIMANGKVDDKERAFLIRIMDLLEQDGYEISLPV